jgi:hypothetical protein
MRRRDFHLFKVKSPAKAKGPCDYHKAMTECAPMQKS